LVFFLLLEFAFLLCRVHLPAKAKGLADLKAEAIEIVSGRAGVLGRRPDAILSCTGCHTHRKEIKINKLKIIIEIEIEIQK